MMEREIIRAGKFTIPVLYLDNHLLVVEKPVNMPTQADDSGDTDVLSACKKYIGEKFEKPGAVYLGLVHRLDRPVGGAMVLARTSKAAERLSKAFSAHTVDKSYLAVVRGILKEERALTDWLIKDGYTGMVRVVGKETPGAKEARLKTVPVETREGLTLARVTLYTGRAHQIRVQHANAGLPIWGDARYGGGMPGEQIALWAHQLTIEHPTKKEPMTFLSPPPNIGAWRVFEDVLMHLQ